LRTEDWKIDEERECKACMIIFLFYKAWADLDIPIRGVGDSTSPLEKNSSINARNLADNIYFLSIKKVYPFFLLQSLFDVIALIVSLLERTFHSG
jgi:hypothetical protein